MQFFAHRAFAAKTESLPVRGEDTGVGGARTERGNEIVERFDATELFGRQANELAEAAVQRANFLARADEHHALLEPFNDIYDFGNAVVGRLFFAVFWQAFEQSTDAAISGEEQGLEADARATAQLDVRQDLPRRTQARG